MIYLRRFTSTMPQFVFNDEVVSGHSSRGIVSDIEKKNSLSLSLFLSTFESSLGSETGRFHIRTITGRSPSPNSRGKREIEESRCKILL